MSSDESAPRLAFPISARTTDTSAAPTSAEAYLACVRAEAAALPDVFVSAVRAPVAPPSGHAFAALRRARAAYVPGWAAPCAVWAGELCYWFASLQQEVVRARGGRGVEVVPAVADGEAWRRAVWEVKGGAPRLEMVLAMDHVRVAKALDVFDSCLREAPRLDEKGGLREGGAVEAACIADDVLSGYRAQWLFSLLSCLLLPLSGSCAASVRSILQKLTVARLGLSGADDDRLPPLNVLIVIMGRHFGQA